MNLTEVLEKLRDNEEPAGRLSVLFVNKQGIRYNAFNPQTSNDVQTNVVSLFIDNLVNIIDSNLEEVDFNPSGQLVDQYSVCDYDYVGNFEEVLDLFNNTSEEEFRADQISYLIFRLRVNKEDEPLKYVYLFRRNNKLKSIRKGFWIRKVTDTYSKLESDLIGIDGNIDAIAYDGELAFFAHIAAERFFNLREKFQQNAREILSEIRSGNTIENFDEFQEDCLNDARVTRRLTKMQSNPEIIELFHDHFENAEEVVELFDLNIIFNEDKSKILYTETSQLTDITMLMRDAYYRTVLADRKGIDDFN